MTSRGTRSKGCLAFGIFLVGRHYTTPAIKERARRPLWVSARGLKGPHLPRRRHLARLAATVGPLVFCPQVCYTLALPIMTA
jgi:hypothetical protein